RSTRDPDVRRPAGPPDQPDFCTTCDLSGNRGLLAVLRALIEGAQCHRLPNRKWSLSPRTPVSTTSPASRGAAAGWSIDEVAQRPIRASPKRSARYELRRAVVAQPLAVCAVKDEAGAGLGDVS